MTRIALAAGLLGIAGIGIWWLEVRLRDRSITRLDALRGLLVDDKEAA